MAGPIWISAGGGRLGCAHGGLMLGAGGGIEVHGNAAGHDDGSVVAEVEIAGDAEDHGQRGEEDEEGDPAAVQAEAAAGEPEGAHGVALDDGGMAVDAADGEAEEQGAAGLPAKVEPPAEPEGPGAQVGRGEQQAERDGDADAGAAGTRQQRLHDGVIGGESERRAEGAHRADEALESVAAKGNLFSQRGEREESASATSQPQAEAPAETEMAMPPPSASSSTQTTARPQPVARPSPTSLASPAAAAIPARLMGCIWR